MFNLVWNGEIIDTFDTAKEASAMAREHAMAYGGYVSINRQIKDKESN